MEGLAPVLECLLELRFGLENGRSLRAVVQDHIASRKAMYQQLAQVWAAVEQGSKQAPEFAVETTNYEKSLLALVERGLKAEPILNRLVEFEDEVVLACRKNLDRELAKLPMLGLLPLMGFQFPAFLILLFGPMMMHLFKSLEQ